MLNLVKPDIKYKSQYIKMIDEWKITGEELSPWVLEEDYSNFNSMVEKFQHLEQGIDIPKGFVPNSTYWVYNNESSLIIGAVNIRHYLNHLFVEAWGNIGYGVSPSERRKGYATIILKLAIEECKKLNIEKALLGCYKENIASVKTILKNGAILENEIIENNTGEIIQRYWVSI